MLVLEMSFLFVYQSEPQTQIWISNFFISVDDVSVWNLLKLKFSLLWWFVSYILKVMEKFSKTTLNKNYFDWKQIVVNLTADLAKSLRVRTVSSSDKFLPYSSENVTEKKTALNSTKTWQNLKNNNRRANKYLWLNLLKHLSR